jgi:hypothetical protein
MERRKKANARQMVHCHYNFIKIWQRRYAHMKARQEGRASHQSNGALGKPICTPHEFEQWCMGPNNFSLFIAMYHDWAMNGFNRWESPSIDRIDPNLGYTTDNIQWLTFEENCIKNNKDPITHQQMREAIYDREEVTSRNN